MKFWQNHEDFSSDANKLFLAIFERGYYDL